MSTHGPLIVDRRPRAKRRCLRCSRVFSTTIDRRICKVCSVVNSQMQIGELAENSAVFVAVSVWG